MKFAKLITIILLNTFLYSGHLQANDICSQAIEIPVSPGHFCTSIIHGDTYSATNDTIPDQCGDPNKDVWFKFTATATSLHLSSEVTSYAFGYCDQYIAVYSGDCNNLSPISCNNGSLTNLMVGEKYFVRVACSAEISFDICITESTNMGGCASFELPINYGNSCDPTELNSFNSVSIQNPTCGNLSQAIWSEFTATSDGDYEIRVACYDWDNFYVNVVVYDTATCEIDISSQIYCEVFSQDSILLPGNLSAGHRYHVLLLPSDNRNFEICLSAPMTPWQRNDSNIFHLGGNVGINTIDPQYDLDISGNIRITGELIADSDVRFKRNIRPLHNSRSVIEALRPISYELDLQGFPERNFQDRRSLGLLAQEVEPILPSIVRTSADGYKGINYIQLIPVLISALQEQQHEIDALRTQMHTLIRTQKRLQLK